MSKLHVVAALLAGAVMTMPALAAAQQPVPEGEDFGDIVVTAQKKSEALQSVPAAVTAVSGERLVSLGVENVAGLAAITPSVKFTSLRQQTLIYLRGVGQALTSSNADPAVATNFNGVYLPAETSGGAFFDLERVEVLPGPQGTLYGRNAAGGVVNVITRRPGDKPGAEGFVEIGNYSRVQAFAAADLPLSDTLAIRLAGNAVRHDGYFDNGGDDRDGVAARLTMRWRPTEATEVLATAGYGHEGGIGAQTQNNPIPGRPRHLPFSPSSYGFYNDFESHIGTLEWRQQFGDNVSLTYIGGYSKIDGGQDDELFLGPPIGLVEVLLTTRSITQELRLNVTTGAVDLVTGLYYYDAQADYATDLRIGPRRSLQSFEQDSDGQAVFGQATFGLTDAFRVTAGLRYSHDRKRIDGFNQGLLSGVAGPQAPFVGRISFDRLDWRGAFEFDIAPESLAYAGVSSGFNQGGFSTTSASPGSTLAATFRPIELIAYTAGLKNRLFGHRLTLNLEAFYYDYKNYQVAARNVATGQNQVFNADKARVYGAEADIRFEPTRSDELSLKVAYLNARATRLVTPAGRFDGNSLPYSPRWTINANYRREFDLKNGAVVEALVNYQYTGSQFAVYTHAPGTFLEDKTKLDASLTYRSAQRNWSVALWGRNLANTTAFALVNAGAIPGPGSGFLEPPRTYGIRLGAEF